MPLQLHQERCLEAYTHPATICSQTQTDTGEEACQPWLVGHPYHLAGSLVFPL